MKFLDDNELDIYLVLYNRTAFMTVRLQETRLVFLLFFC